MEMLFRIMMVLRKDCQKGGIFYYQSTKTVFLVNELTRPGFTEITAM
jgi:hypothetical protein